MNEPIDYYVPFDFKGKHVLVVEDDPDRAEWFRQKFTKTGVAHWHIATNAHSAIEKLKTEDYDVIFLDHDLDQDAHDRAGTGYDVAYWMEMHDNNRQALVIIHSVNPTGAFRISMALRKWYPIRCPFTVLLMLAS